MNLPILRGVVPDRSSTGVVVPVEPALPLLFAPLPGRKAK
jgi:hypothetical protein